LLTPANFPAFASSTAAAGELPGLGPLRCVAFQEIDAADATHTDAATKDACITACNECLRACRECIVGCDCPGYEKTCLTCIETCRTCIALLEYDSAMAEEMCEVCEEACEQCADECTKCGDEPCCKACAAACRKCHDGAAFDNRRYRGNVGDQQLDLADRVSGCRSTKQNYRRTRRVSHGENGAEVGISRDDNPLIAVRVLNNRFVIRSRKPKIPT
jgi:hypothetical protein